MKPNNSFHSPQPSENKRDSRCKTGSCSGDYKVTPAIRQQNELPETVNPYNQETPSTDRDKDKIEYRAVPNSINEAAKETDNDISDSEAATDQSESIPPCLGGDCDLSNIHDILNDCTGSGCPPKNDEWYQKFLGIAKPDHSYFDRNWQHDQNYRKNYIKSLKTPPQIHKRNLFLKTKTDLETLSHDMKIKHSEFPSVNRKSFKKKPSQSKFDINSRIKKGIDKSKEKTNDETLISDAPKCRDDLCIDSEEIDEDFDRLVPDEKDQDMEFMCPAGYAKETRGEVTFCKPMQGLVKTEHVSERNCEGMFWHVNQALSFLFSRHDIPFNIKVNLIK